jgi:haloalkane dehalogenase
LLIRLIFVLQRLLKKKKYNYSISPEDRYERKRINVLDTEMSYIDIGKGNPIVFLHGNPTSSYLWRNIIPRVEDLGRCLAPDLIGMGRSGQSPNGSYRFEDHIRYLDAWFSKLQLNNVTLVVHDWGSALGFHWANRNRDRVKGIVYMESFVRPVSWKEWPLLARPIFKLLRSPLGKKFILKQNGFVQLILPSGVIRELSKEEMESYREPFPNQGEGRRPILTWAREVPLDGTPEDVYKIIDSYAKWLSTCDLPKLFINAEPGLILTGQQREFCRNWPNQKEVPVKGLHFVQEDSPQEIGDGVAEFIKGLDSRKK